MAWGALAAGAGPSLSSSISGRGRALLQQQSCLSSEAGTVSEGSCEQSVFPGLAGRRTAGSSSRFLQERDVPIFSFSP